MNNYMNYMNKMKVCFHFILHIEIMPNIDIIFDWNDH